MIWDLFKRLMRSDSGSVLMEFLIVVPLYFALWSGLFIMGDLTMLRNRIAVTDRNLGYLSYRYSITDRELILDYYSKSIFGTEAKNIASDPNNLANNITLHAGTFAARQQYVHSNLWGTLLGSFSSVSNVKTPSWIIGMFYLVDVLSGDLSGISNSSTLSFLRNVGTFSTTNSEHIGRHHVFVRNLPEESCASRISRSEIQKIENDYFNESPQKKTYYQIGEHFFNMADRAGITPWLGDEQNTGIPEKLTVSVTKISEAELTPAWKIEVQEGGIVSNVIMNNYNRDIFGGFFTALGGIKE